MAVNFAENSSQMATSRNNQTVKLAAATAGDWVLIAGKGHETGQIFADREEPFSDLAVVEDWLREAA